MCAHFWEISTYEEHLIKLEPYIRILSSHARIVWLMQNPVLDFHQKYIKTTTIKTLKCNKIAKKMFQYVNKKRKN